MAQGEFTKEEAKATAQAKLEAAKAEVARIEGDAAFTSGLEARKEAQRTAERDRDEAAEAYRTTFDTVAVKLRFYEVVGGPLRRSYLDVIGEKIGVPYDDRAVLARANAYNDDPFEAAARNYAAIQVRKDSAVAEALERLKVLRAKVTDAMEAVSTFERPLRRAKATLQAAERDVAGATKRAGSSLGTPAERKAARAAIERRQKAKRLLAEIAAGQIDLKVKP